MKKKTAAKAGIMFAKDTGYPFDVGDKILVRTVTMYQLGKVVGIGPDSITLADASWIADVGRLGNALEKGCDALGEIEKAPSWICVGRGAIVDVYPWNHPLPATTK